MSDVERRPKVATFEGVPIELIQEAQSTWPRISVKLQRRVAGGKLAGLGSKMMTPAELGDIENYLGELCGGGTYRVEPRDPNDMLSYTHPIPPFTVEVAGPPKPATAFEHGFRVPSGLGISALDAADVAASVHVPAWVPLEHRAAWAQQSEVQASAVAAHLGVPVPLRAQAPAAAFASDQLAVKQLDEVRAEMVQDRANAARREKQLLEELEKSRKAVEAHKDEERSLREKNERDTLKLQLEAITREMQALKMAPPPAPPKPALAPEVWVALVGALAPVLTAVVQSGAARQDSLAVQQAKMAELQMTGLSTVMGAAGNKKSDFAGVIEGALKLSPMLLPVITEFFKNKSPAAQANLFSTLMENNLTTLSTMGSFVQGMMELQGGDPWWRPMVENGIQSVVQAAQGYAELAQQKQGQGAPAGTATPSTKLASSGMQMAALIVNSPQFPRELKNGAWAEVIAALHDKAPAENIAGFVRDELVAMRDKKTLPEIFAQIFETPEQSLGLLIANLPIYKQDRAYADGVIQAVGKAVRALTVVDAEGSEEGPGDENEDDGDGDGDEEGGESEKAESIPFNINSARRPGARVPQAVPR